MPIQDVTDGDDDRPGYEHYDNDNDAKPGYGRTAGAVERRAIVAAIRRYYEAAVAGHAQRACSRLYFLTVESLLEDHHVGNGPRALQGATCAQILARLLAPHRRELREDLGNFALPVVQVQGNRATAIARFGPVRERLIPVHREGRTWKVVAVIDDGSP